jgi:hypothetical protein
MSGRLSMLLRLHERQPDRVRVAVRMCPKQAVQVEGVALELFDGNGEPLSTRLILPISGSVEHAFSTTVELRSHGPIPEGSRVVATAWTESGPLEATCPADPCPDLHDHLQGRGLISMYRQGTPLHGLGHQERCRLGQVFGWLAPSVPCQPRVLEDHGHLVDEVCEDLGLDEEQSEWVRGLMAED